MSAAAMAVPMGPPGGSLIGRSLKAVLWSGVFGSLGGTIGGWIKGSTAGKVLGASIGAGSALLGFGVAKGFQDKKMWNRYQWERFHYAKETGELLPNLERGRAFWKRRLKNVVGVGLVGGALVLAGLGPAMTAVPALAFWGAAVAGSYMLTRLAYRPRRPDFKSLPAMHQPEAEPEAPEEAQPPRTNIPINQRLSRSLADAEHVKDQYVRQVRRPGGRGLAA